jgi:ABC-type multidrug transport system ATPase subunit
MELKLDIDAGEQFSKIPQAISECKAIDIEWERLTVTAVTRQKVIENGKKFTKVSQKTILNDVGGSIKHGKFTAILGPSGSGKTTLLNFLSARIDNKLQITGNIKVNSQAVDDIEFIGNLVAFVQQDDILLPTMTPREVFTFAANLRLNLSNEEKVARVEKIIEELDLSNCADTRVGSTEIRGLSGGERKRTSIGVDLITNPSLVFLDEPTTGLDSTTALNVLEVLRRLAKNGRNVVSTIHQPSSEIFSKFDNLILLVRGNIIYQGPSTEAVRYFGGIGYPCPKLTNPADFFMKLMNESGLIIDEIREKKTKAIAINQKEVEAKFQNRLDHLVESYKNSSMIEDTKTGIAMQPVENNKVYYVSWFYQFWLLMSRAFENEIRNPNAVRTRALQMIFFGFLVDALYRHINNGITGIQDRIGVLFLLVSMSGFTSITGSLGTFSQEKPVFLRERLSKSYSPGAYFWGRATSELPFLLAYPIILIGLVYWVIGLNDLDMDKFLITVAFHILTWLAGSAYGLFLSTVISRLEVALAMVPALVIPFLILTGFFVNQNSIPIYFKPIEYISIFKWAFQGTAINEFTDLTLTCSPQCDPLAILDFHQSMTVCLIVLAAIGIAMRIMAYIGLVLISTPQKAKLIKPKPLEMLDKSPERINLNLNE